MSMFLGPIHYWLYNKISNQEKLTTCLAEYAGQNAWIANPDVYTKELPPLDTVIDENNIHGWLRGQITDAELRYAKLIHALSDKGDALKQKAYEFGQLNALANEVNAEEIYKYFDDFFVNGMPCDHVNVVTEQSADQVSWEMMQNIHAQYWERGESARYYELRKAVMDGMVEQTAYTVTMQDDYHYSIRKENAYGI